MSEDATTVLTEQPPAGEQKPDREAARYRKERNQYRDERDALAARIQSLQQREVERIASRDLANPADLFTLSGKTVRDVLGEDGDVDPELVAALVTEVLGTRPGLKTLDRPVDPTQGIGGPPANPTPSWDKVFRQ